MEVKVVAEFFAEHVSREPRIDPAVPRPRPLDPQVRAVMEPRFGYDFSRVRVHTDLAAARERGALAYTTGTDIGFAPGQYRLDNPRGRAILTHELAHVVQQSGQPNSADAPISSPGETAEQAADVAARTFSGTADPEPSVTLSVRDRLRATKSSGPRLLRVASWAGDFATDTYDTVTDPSSGDSIGVDIALRFKPGNAVNATTIGMTQTANSKERGRTLPLNPTVAARSIPAGKPGEGTHIDVLKDYPNPLYAADKPGAKDTLATTPTVPSWGQHGFRFTDAAGKLNTQDALLKDTPTLPGHGPNSGQIFEATAVALAGGQAGTYYGSVQWGWQSDSANKFTKLPLALLVKDVPSATFASAAGRFAATPTSTGATAMPLPTAAGKFTNVIDAELVANPGSAATSTIGKLAKNTRVEVTDQGASMPFNNAATAGAAAAGAAAGAAAAPAALGGAAAVAPGLAAPAAQGSWWRVTVVDGVLIGRVGWVLASQLSDVQTP
jgi:Domain of unknown function (DUF4157)